MTTKKPTPMPPGMNRANRPKAPDAPPKKGIKPNITIEDKFSQLHVALLHFKLGSMTDSQEDEVNRMIEMADEVWLELTKEYWNENN